MPSIDYNKDGGVITWGPEDFLNGLAPQWVQDGYKVIGKGATFMKNADPFRNLGRLTPGYTPAAATNVSVITSVLRNIVGFAGYGYAIEHANNLTDGPGVHRIDLSTDTITNNGTWPHITATGYLGRDCIAGRLALYGSNAEEDMIFFTTDTGSHGKIMAYNITENVWNNNFDAAITGYSSSGLATGVPLSCIRSSYDGLIYITNDNYVCSYDIRTGTNGTINYTAFTLPSGFSATSFSELPTHLVIYAYRSDGGHNFVGGTAYHGKAIAIFWNRVASQADYIYDLDDSYVDAGWTKGGKIGCFTYGRTKGGDGKLAAIREFDGSKYVIPENGMFSGNIPRHGGVDIVDDMVEFLSDGKRYSFGSSDPALPKVLVQKSSSSGTSVLGCLKNLTSNKVYASTGATTSGGLETLSSNYAADTIWQGLTAEPDFPDGMMGEVTKTRTKFLKTASSGRALALAMTTDRATSNTIFSGVKTITAQTTDESGTSKKLISEESTVLPQFTSIRPDLTGATGDGATDSPIIVEIKTYFRNIKQP